MRILALRGMLKEMSLVYYLASCLEKTVHTRLVQSYDDLDWRNLDHGERNRELHPRKISSSTGTAFAVLLSSPSSNLSCTQSLIHPYQNSGSHEDAGLLTGQSPYGHLLWSTVWVLRDEVG